jgi:DNA-binding IclR family transcriptional regulator
VPGTTAGSTPASDGDGSVGTPATAPGTPSATPSSAELSASPGATAAGVGPVVESVDRALRLLTVLGSGGPRGVTDLARQIEVAPSTAHRLLSTLAARGYAVQLADRRYDAGPALLAPGANRYGGSVTEVVRPYLEQLFAECGETCHLLVRIGHGGGDVLFADGLESEQGLRVGSRTGMTMPAWTTSGGKAMLAELDALAAEQLALGGTDGPDATPARKRSAAFATEYAEIRRLGYGVNENESERGVTAVGVSLGIISGRHVALTVSLPSVRVTPALLRSVAASAVDVAARARAALTNAD